MNRPLLDVVIPARNEESTIGRILDMVSVHRHVNHVHVIVDKDTIDETANIARYANPRKISVREPDISGKGQLVTFGLRLVDTPRVIFLDADITELEPIHIHWLAKPEFDMGVLVPRLPDLHEYSWNRKQQIIRSWPYVSGLRSVPTHSTRTLDLHGYLMETQINNMAQNFRWRVHYFHTKIVSPLKLTEQRLIEMERDRKWGLANGVF